VEEIARVYAEALFEAARDNDVLDAIHERILPLKGYQPRTNQTLGELVRRSRAGV